MRINNINSVQTGFKSKFVPNKVLEQTFDKAYSNSDRIFLNSVKAILNDGKDNLIELNQNRSSSSMDLLCNGYKILSEQINYYTIAGIRLIKTYAKEIPGYTLPESKYANMSDEEKRIASHHAIMIKWAADNFNKNTDVIKHIQEELNLMKFKLDDYTKEEIQKIKEIIFTNK